jgi:hypothetical protein
VVERFRTVLELAQIGEVEVTEAVGTGITVTVVVAVTAEQGPVVTLYVYTVVAVGVTANGKVGAVVELAYNVPPGAAVIIYVVTPATTGVEVPVRLVDAPLQMVAAAAVSVTVGTGRTVTATVAVAEPHGAEVTVYV